MIRRVSQAFQSIAPLEAAASWDNVGILVEAPHSAGESVVLCNDLTDAVILDAVDKKCGVIVSYHPPIFSGLKSLSLQVPKQRQVMECIQKGISLFSPHTSFDAHPQGINCWLARQATGQPGTPCTESMAQYVNIKISLSQVIQNLKCNLQIQSMMVTGQAEEFQRVVVAAGSGASLFEPLKEPRGTLFITGEVSYHEALMFQELGHSLIKLEHEVSEQNYMQEIKVRLEELLQVPVYNHRQQGIFRNV